MLRDFGLYVVLTIASVTNFVCVAPRVWAQAEPPQLVGNVLSVHGIWHSTHIRARSLSLGDPVYEGDYLDCSPRAGSDPDITTTRLDGSPPKTYRYLKGECSFQVEPLPPDGPNPISFASMFRALADLFRTDKPEQVAFISRGPELHEAVLPLTADKIDVTAAIESLPSGNYALKLTPLQSSSGAQASYRVESFTWESGGHAKVAVPHVAPGLYRLQIEDTNNDSVSGPVAVLLSKQETFETDASAYSKAELAQQSWTSIDPDAQHYFLTAYLYAIAQGVVQRDTR